SLERRFVHRSPVQAQARPRAQEIHEGGKAGSRVIRSCRLSPPVLARKPRFIRLAALQDRHWRRIGEMSLRIVFMGTPEFAVPTLVEIVGRGHELVAVYTRAPKPGGRRGLDLTPSPIEREARRFALPVFTPATLRTSEAADAARAHGADVAVVVAYGLIL